MSMIKLFKPVVVSFLFSFCVLQAQADISNSLMLQRIVSQAFQEEAPEAARINWRVGEYHKGKLKIVFGGGDYDKSVTQDVPDRNAFWYVTNISIMGQKQKSESLISRANGELLELIVNGEKQSLEPQDPPEILEQYETRVKVAAGEYDCIYIKAQIKAQGQTQVVELWINPLDVNLDGILKVVSQTPFGPSTLELHSFGRN